MALLLPASVDTTKTVSLTQGFEALIDAVDFDNVMPFQWCALRTGGRVYAVRTTPGSHHGLTYMHRLIVGTPPGRDTDHRDRSETLDNRRANLRTATRSQNMANREMSKHNRHGHVGVKRTTTGKFIGIVQKQGKQYRTKTHATVESAAQARGLLARELFGEFAVTSTPIAA